MTNGTNQPSPAALTPPVSDQTLAIIREWSDSKRGLSVRKHGDHYVHLLLLQVDWLRDTLAAANARLATNDALPADFSSLLDGIMNVMDGYRAAVICNSPAIAYDDARFKIAGIVASTLHKLHQAQSKTPPTTPTPETKSPRTPGTGTAAERQ